MKSLDCDNSSVGTNLLFHKFSMATGSGNEDQVSDELKKSWQLKMSWFQTLACPSHGFGSREPSGYFVRFSPFYSTKVFFSHLNSFFTGGLERTVGALEAKRHCLGFHPATAVKIILSFSGSNIHNIRQTYGRIQITLIDKNGLNETFLLTRYF